MITWLGKVVVILCHTDVNRARPPSREPRCGSPPCLCHDISPMGPVEPWGVASVESVAAGIHLLGRQPLGLYRSSWAALASPGVCCQISTFRKADRLASRKHSLGSARPSGPISSLEQIGPSR